MELCVIFDVVDICMKVLKVVIGYCLNGEKMMVVLVVQVCFILVLVVDENNWIVGFIVDGDSVGLCVMDEYYMGLRLLNLSCVMLEDV